MLVALVAAYFVGRPFCKDIFHPQAMRRLAAAVGWTPIDLVPAIRGRLPWACLDDCVLKLWTVATDRHFCRQRSKFPAG